jgi:iron(III) transport system substrate-binding protein
VKAFEKQTGVIVKVRSDDEDVLAQQIEQEGSRSPADVFFTENTPPLGRLDEKGLLAAVPAQALAAAPARYSASDGNWVGVSARVSVLVYNTSQLKASQLPKSVLGLASPKWKGKLDIAPSETDFAPIVPSIAQDKGDAAAVAWLKALKALKANAGSHQDPDNETLVANVNQGTTELGVINHYYWYRLRDEVGQSGLHSRLATFAPGDDGYLLDVSGAAVLTSSRHRAAARALVAFLVSSAGEHILASSDSWEYPVASGVTNPALPPLSSFHPRSFGLTQIGDGSHAISLLQQAGLL